MMQKVCGVQSTEYSHTGGTYIFHSSTHQLVNCYCPDFSDVRDELSVCRPSRAVNYHGQAHGQGYQTQQ